MPSNIDETIKTITSLPWDGVLKLAVVAAILFFGYGEYMEDSEGTEDTELQRDLSVFTLSAIESLRSSIENKESTQDAKLEALENELDEIQ